jgi:chorismate synthase
MLAEFGISIGSHIVMLGGLAARRPDVWPDDITAIADASPLRPLDPQAESRMIDEIDAARAEGDTLGGTFEVVAQGLPVGLGSHVSWDRKLDGRLAGALMSIQAMKGVEIGLGFEAARRRGSGVHDEIEAGEPGRTGGFRRSSNNAGGLEGGITTGAPLVARVAMKPLSSLMKPLRSVDLRTGSRADAVRERSDVVALAAAGVVGEAMVMLTLAAFVAEKFGGDTMADVRANMDTYRARISAAPEAPVAGGRHASASAAPQHGLTGTDEAGSGGDD